MKRENFYAILLMSLLASCMGGKSDIEDITHQASTASFDVAPISAAKSDNTGMGSSDHWREIPVEKNITFKVCLNDKTLQIPLQHQKIQIETPFNTIRKETNTQGCTTFSESFHYEYFSQEKLRDYPITLRGISGHPGVESIPLKVNPWSESLNTLVFDQRFDDIPNTRISSNELGGPLKAMGISLNFFNNGFKKDTQSAFYIFKINHEVLAQHFDLEGNLLNKKLQSGYFQVEAELIEERNGAYQKISSTSKSATLRSGLLQEDLTFNFPRGFQHHPDSSFYVVYDLRPIGLEVKSHHGVLALANLNGNNQGTLETLEQYPLELSSAPLKSEVILKREALDSEQDTEGENEEFRRQNNSGVTIASINVGPGILLPGEHHKSSARMRRHPVEICLVDTLSSNGNRPLPNTKVSLEVLQNRVLDTEIPRVHTTNVNGCFQSHLLLSYDYLDCEKFFTMDYNIQIIDGRYQDMNVSGLVAINPFNNNDLYYDLNQAQTPPKTQCEPPKLMVTQFHYKNEGNKRDGYYINRNLNLTLMKKYSFDFQPQFVRGNSYQEVKNFENLYQGKIKVVASLFSPKHAEINRFTLVEEEWDYLTSAQTIVEVKPNGVVQGELQLPFHLSELLFLGFQNNLMVSLYPEEGLNLEPLHFNVPFHAVAAAGDFKTRLIEPHFSEELQARIDNTLKRGAKIPGLHTNDQFTLHDEREITPLKRYRLELERLAGKNNASLVSGNEDDFNKIKPLNKDSWDDNKTYHTTFTKNEFRTITTNYGDLPKSFLNRFCRLYYNIPTKNQRRTFFFGNSDTTVGGEELALCLESPQEYIELTPMSFVEEIIANEVSASYKGNDFNGYQASYIQDEEGKIRRGNAYFAAYGDRSSINWGESKHESIEHTYSYGLEGPTMLFIGTREARSSSQETFTVKNTAEMRAAFNRYYTSRDLIDLTYNSVTLEFPARMKDCITLRPIKSKGNVYNFCREKTRIKRMQETWFFIGDTNTQNHGVLSDGNIVGDNNRRQVIRGKQNFNLLWDKYETEDALLVVEELGTITVGDAFTKYINREKGLIPFENKYDHSFPGMMIPVSHEPTRTCNDCQDP